MSQNESESENEYYLTRDHFAPLDANRKLSDSTHSGETNSGKSSRAGSSSGESDYETESNEENNSDAGSESGSDAGSDAGSDSGSDSGSESEELSESETMDIDPEDLFNTKTNGNEFFGEVLKNRYLIIKKLGYGSFSSVWMAYDVDKNELVAVKIINPQDYREGMIELQTYKKLEKLDSTYLLTMLECFQVTPIHPKYYEESYKKKNKKNRNHIVIILPLMACSTFDLLKCDEYEDGLPLPVCKEIIKQTLLGIKELEKNNMMHTDLKPENILVCGLNREAEILFSTFGKDKYIKKTHDDKLKELQQKKTLSEQELWLTSYKIYKKITQTIIKFMKNDMIDVKKSMKSCKVRSDYIKNIRIKICDFNLVLDTQEHIGDLGIEIQTRYYRAPEIILGSGLHKKTDYWSIGCILFELLTGEILFDPEKDNLRSRDIHHLYLIEELIGKIPASMIKDADNKDKLFDKKGYLLNVGMKIKKWELEKVFKENHENVGLPEETISKVVKFINSTLNIHPENRPSLKKMLADINQIDV
jgi:serine/threonine-protein kinase SRPK3